MIFRTYALYGGNAVVLICLALLLIVEIVIMASAVKFMEGGSCSIFNSRIGHSMFLCHVEGPDPLFGIVGKP
jgi:hypothetical protein